ncbi:MAG: transcriptional regulator [Candidatus Wolframiiraptor sp.]|nr:MAG: transcriptional regulator [Candidatus Wolframiiraptor sp.]
MTRDQLIGGLMMAAAVIGILVYAWILFFTDWALILLQITAFIAVAGVLGILAWIGYTLATTPPPKPIEEIEKELEKEVEAAENDSKQEENSSD